MSTRFMEIIENISNCLNSVCAVELLCRANWIYRHSLRNQQNILSPPIRTLYHFTQVHLQIKDGDNNNKEESRNRKHSSAINSGDYPDSTEIILKTTSL